MSRLPFRSVLWLVAALLVSALSWIYMHRVLLPWEQYGNAQHGLIAQMGDLFPRWVGARELLLNGRNPYGPEVSAEIQTAFYGHPIRQTYDKPQSEIVDEQRFVYPIYVVLPLAPTVHLDFEPLQRWAPFVLGAFVAITVWLWIRVLRWRPPWWALGAAILFVLSGPQIAQGLRLRQLGIGVAMLLALATWCVTRNQNFLAGVALACSTIKPQMMILCALWFLLWALGDFRKRWPLAAGFGLGLGTLIGIGEMLLRGWIRYFFDGLAAYRRYFPTTSLVRLILGNWLGGTLSILAVALLLAWSWRKRRASADSDEFVFVLALYFVASTLVLPLLPPYNQVLLLLPLLLFVRDWSLLSRWGRIALVAIVCWPPLAWIALLLHPPRLDSLTQLPLLPTTPALLLPFLTLVLMLANKHTEASLPAESHLTSATSIS